MAHSKSTGWVCLKLFLHHAGQSSDSDGKDRKDLAFDCFSAPKAACQECWNKRHYIRRHESALYKILGWTELMCTDE